ncbi:tumor necrosis factor receptor superfamily member 1A isoform X2 [Clupea harengus]|uniref:Tumor necrosis factor receptor superfamily member 1A isoform X2 n=1 Tax=Clupea harengus TaxID=7950 RepID=A0A6P8FG29_CLUHA|nr:tumor necrosis factor receptor superfamily member 1A isoform X2 [Clupea harengus]
MMNLIINFSVWLIFRVLPIVTAFFDPQTCHGTLTENETKCCMECHSDTYGHKGQNCPGDTVPWTRGPDGTWDRFSNCNECTQCDHQVNQIEEHPCTPIADRICGCKDGYFKIKLTDYDITCEKCQEFQPDFKCPECVEGCHNGYVNETGILDTGTPCQKQDCKIPLCKDSHICADKPAINLPVWVIVIVLILLLLVGLLLISVRHLDHCGRKPCWTAEAKNNNLPDQRNEDTCTSTHVSYTGVKKGGGLGNNQSAQCLTDQPLDQINIPIPQEMMVSAPVLDTPVQPSEETQMDTYTQSLIKNELRGHFSSPMLLSIQNPYPNEAQVLYTIIREVPVRRWKEFLRLLSVPDEEIERVEMEPRASYLEHQYQMLRVWSQGSNVNLTSIYSTLHSMGLSGCADKLQDKLQRVTDHTAN